MSVTRKILAGCSTKELIWDYKSILYDCLPAALREQAGNLDSPEIILESIARKQRDLDSINRTPLKELIDREIADYNNWMSILEANLTDDQKIMREKCNNTIAELNKWKPVSDSSKELKIQLIELIRNNVEYYLYGGLGHPEDFNAEFAERKIIQRKNELIEWIENLKIQYPQSVKFHKERSLLESQLEQDLKLLV
jgi:hypothetical protein